MIWGKEIIIIENIWSPAKNIVQSILCVVIPETPTLCISFTNCFASLLLCVPASLSTDTLWVTPRSPSVCSRVWSRWSTPSPSTTWAASSLTTLWAKSPADSGSTNSRLTKTVSVRRCSDTLLKERVALYQHSCWPLHHLTFVTPGLLLAPTWATQD